MRLPVALLALVLTAGCAGVQSHPYWLANTDLKCDGVELWGELPLTDPIQTFSVCEDRAGQLYFPNGVTANTTLGSVSGAMSAALAQSAAIGAMLGGF